MEPVIKWVGGKRQLLNEIDKRIPSSYNCYYEAFVGGGAVLFHLQPQNAVLGDMNEELINLYKVIKNKHLKLIEKLEEHKVRNCQEYYYMVRALDRTDDFKKLTDVERAARFIYLNKVCYNGLWRVNKKGQNNTPYGKYKNPSIYSKDVIVELHNYFRQNNVQMVFGDFEATVESATAGDFVYFDPPYAPINANSFTAYASNGFGIEEQKRLKELCDRLNAKGVKFLLSNSNCQLVRELYKDYTIEIVEANRAVNSDATKRGKVEEVLVRNYEDCRPSLE